METSIEYWNHILSMKTTPYFQAIKSRSCRQYNNGATFSAQYVSPAPTVLHAMIANQPLHVGMNEPMN